MSDKLADWTKGAEAIVYQSCGPCGNVQYFHRHFCAACGASDLVETHLQMTERAGARQVRDASMALLHGDGGVLSSHVSMFLERVR